MLAWPAGRNPSASGTSIPSPSRPSVATRHAGCAVDSRDYSLATTGCAANSMLGAEERSEPNSGRVMKKIDAALPAFIATGVIRDEPNALSANEVERVLKED